MWRVARPDPMYTSGLGFVARMSPVAAKLRIDRYFLLLRVEITGSAPLQQDLVHPITH